MPWLSTSASPPRGGGCSLAIEPQNLGIGEKSRDFSPIWDFAVEDPVRRFEAKDLGESAREAPDWAATGPRPPEISSAAFLAPNYWFRSWKRRWAVDPEQIPVASNAFHWQPVRST